MVQVVKMDPKTPDSVETIRSSEDRMVDAALGIGTPSHDYPLARTPNQGFKAVFELDNGDGVAGGVAVPVVPAAVVAGEIGGTSPAAGPSASADSVTRKRKRSFLLTDAEYEAVLKFIDDLEQEEIEIANDEDRKIYLCPKVAQRIFSEQLRNITEEIKGQSFTVINVSKVLAGHKKRYGYQMKPETLGFQNLWSGIKSLPFVELIVQNDEST